MNLIKNSKIIIIIIIWFFNAWIVNKNAKEFVFVKNGHWRFCENKKKKEKRPKTEAFFASQCITKILLIGIKRKKLQRI